MIGFKRILDRLSGASAVGVVVALIVGLSMPAADADAAVASVGWLQNAGASQGGSSICLDVKTAFVYPGYATVQSTCQTADLIPRSQLWQGYQLSPSTWQLRNKATGDCLWADPQQAYDGGAVYAVPCNANDPYQQWILQLVPSVQNGLLLQNAGTQTTCLDADGGTGGGAGQQVWQWTCGPASGSTIDTFQVWIN